MSIVAVAKAAGVSHTTVSRVINNHPAVSAETIQQVQAAIRKLGYVPPTRRRGPRSRARRGIHTRTIALLVSNVPRDDSGVPVIATLLEQVEHALAEAGLSLMFARIHNDQPLPSVVRDRMVDGLLMYGRPVSPAVAAQLESFPSVWMLTRRGDLPASDCVQPDNGAAGRLAVEYLAQRGHRHLAIVSSRPDDAVIRSRADGFAAAAGHRGLSSQVLIEDPPGAPTEGGPRFEYDLEPMRARIAHLAALSPLPTGLFVPNAELAVLTYRALAEQGLRPGEDVEVVCCNRNPLLLSLDPVPAVIDVRPGVVGRRAVKQLLWRMQHRHDASRVVINILPTLLEPHELGEGHGQPGSNRRGQAATAETAPEAGELEVAV